MAAWLDNCRFFPTAGGTTDWTYASTVGGCQSPSNAGAVNGTKYKLIAISPDLTQWEIVEGAYNSSTGTFPRTTVLYNSSGTGASTGQSGAGTKINFSAVPQVAVVGIKEDLISVEEANSFSTAQQRQAAQNIGLATATRSITGASDALVASDFGKLIILNRSSAITLGSSAAAALGNGWYCDVVNINSGICTFTPGSGSIDGVATAGVYQNESMRIWCDGTNFYTTNHGGDWVSYAPTASASGPGAFTAVIPSGRFCKIRTRLHLELSIQFTNAGTATGFVQASLPVSASSSMIQSILTGAELSTTGKALYGFISTGSSVIQVRYFDNSQTATSANNGTSYQITGTYEVSK